ncbi:MAG: MFS transporter [Gemmatimonadota bacterium]|nr:MFS transporter [Gemmatimonadota bacterium]
MLPGAQNPFHALRHRNFRLFSIGQFISLAGTWMQVVALGWLVLDLTDSPFYVGLVSTLTSLPILLFTLWGGVLADRVHRRRALILLQSFMLADALALALLTLTGHITVQWVMVLALVHGTSAAFEVPIRQAFIVEMVGKEDLMNAIALNSSNFNITRIFGPMLAGLVVGSVGVAPCFVLNAVSFVAVIACLLRMEESDARPAPSGASALTTLREGYRYVLDQPLPRALLLLTALYAIFGFAFVSMLPVFARDVLRTGAAGYGGLMTAVGVGASAGALAMAALGHRVARLRIIRGAGMLFALTLALTALAQVWWLAAGVLAVAGCAMILNNVSTNTQLQMAAPDHLRGRVMGFYSLMVLGMAPLGSFQAGWVSEHFGVPMSLALGAVVTAAGTLWLARPRATAGAGARADGA